MVQSWIKHALWPLWRFYWPLVLLLCYLITIPATASAASMSGNLRQLTPAIMNLTPPSKTLTLSLKAIKTEPSELMNLLEIQTLSLENLEANWQSMVLQLENLEKTKSELTKEQARLLQTISDLENSLMDLQTASLDLQRYNADLMERLKKINKQYRNLIAAGVICGACLGAGLSMLTIGAVTARPALTYTGLAIGGGAILTFSIGKITHIW